MSDLNVTTIQNSNIAKTDKLLAFNNSDSKAASIQDVVQLVPGKMAVATCSTAGNVATKAVTCADWNNEPGMSILVEFSNANSADNVTLSINNGTAIPVYYMNTATEQVSGAAIPAGAVVFTLNAAGNKFYAHVTKLIEGAGVKIDGSKIEAVLTNEIKLGSLELATSNAVAVGLNNLPVDKFNSITTDGNAHTYYVGKTEGAQIAQAYTNIYIRGGRVDNEYGCGIISIYGLNIIDGKLLLAMPNVTVIFTQRDNETEMYVSLQSYTNFVLELAPYSRFNVNIQEVSQIEGNIIWNNAWKSIITTADIIPSSYKFLMSNMQDEGYPNIDGTTIYANDAGRIQARNGVRGVSNPTTGHQWPINSSSTNDEFISLGLLQFYIDKANDKLWVRHGTNIDMGDWKEL